MSAGALPQHVSIRKAVTHEAVYEGVLGTAELPNYAPLLDPENPSVWARIRCGRDEEGRSIAEVAISATVIMECQRTLKPFSMPIEGSSTLGLVLTDDQARHLPAHYEPWIAEDDLDLWAVVAEEIALAMPIVAYDPAGELEPTAVTDDLEEDGVSPEQSTDNPFSVLSALLESGNDEEKK